MHMQKAIRAALPALPRPARLRPLSWLKGAFAARGERRRLASLCDTRLDDIGLSHREALHEAQKPIWDVPAHWLR